MRGTVASIGYDNALYGFDSNTCAVISTINKQSGDIAQGVDTGGAGDQGMMFGYATNETPELMPTPISLAHKLTQRLTEVRKNGTDVVSASRRQEPGDGGVRRERQAGARRCGRDLDAARGDMSATTSCARDILKNVIQAVIPAKLLDEDTKYHINPTGRFVIGGPMGDTGLTGRKIIVDTYGGMGRHGGGAFSGKDPTKVDRSAAYMARYIAKNIVAAGLADRCEVQLAYAIGVAEPVSVLVDTFGTGKVERGGAAEAGPRELLADAQGHHREPEPAPPDLPEDGGLRPLRRPGRGVHLGSDGQGCHAARAGGRGRGDRKEIAETNHERAGSSESAFFLLNARSG